MPDVKHIATVALSSVLTAWENGYPPLPDTIHEMRLAHCLVAQGGSTSDELHSFLGEGWVVRCRRSHRRDMSDTNAVTEAEYAVAQIGALAARLDLAEGFVASLVRPIFRRIERESL